MVYFVYMDTKVLNYRIIIQPEKYADGSTVYTALCPTLGVTDYGDSVEAVLATPECKRQTDSSSYAAGDSETGGDYGGRADKDPLGQVENFEQAGHKLEPI